MMAASFHGSLPTYVFPSPGAGVLSKFVSATAPAIELMTDSFYEDPCAVGPERQIDDALGGMISQGVSDPAYFFRVPLVTGRRIGVRTSEPQTS
jgi:hypothetical protein